MTKPHRCADCGLSDTQRPHQTVWDCKAALKRRIVDIEAEVLALKDQLADSQDTTTRIAEAWREERARWAGLDPARGLDTQGLTGPDGDDTIAQDAK